MMDNMVFDYLSLVLNLLLGGGLIMNIRSLRTMKHDIERAKQDTKAQEIENERSAMDTMKTYIVQPIKIEINGLRREMARLRKAIDKIKSCAYSDNCPVSAELQRSETVDTAEPYGDGFANTEDYR